jgi:hypothetical protein
MPIQRTSRKSKTSKRTRRQAVVQQWGVRGFKRDKDGNTISSPASTRRRRLVGKHSRRGPNTHQPDKIKTANNRRRDKVAKQTRKRNRGN